MKKQKAEEQTEIKKTTKRKLFSGKEKALKPRKEKKERIKKNVRTEKTGKTERAEIQDYLDTQEVENTLELEETLEIQEPSENGETLEIQEPSENGEILEFQEPLENEETLEFQEPSENEETSEIQEPLELEEFTGIETSSEPLENEETLEFQEKQEILEPQETSEPQETAKSSKKAEKPKKQKKAEKTKKHEKSTRPGKTEKAGGKKKSRKKNTGKASITRKMGAKMLAVLLPVIIAAMAVLTVISVRSGGENINSAISDQMDAELKVQGNKVTNYFTKITDIANTLASTVNMSYQQVDITALETALVDIVKKNETVIGSGIWFESGVFDTGEETESAETSETTDAAESTDDSETADAAEDSDEAEDAEEELQYVGPYAMKENGVTQITYKYSSADNSYFKQKFYLIGKEAKEPVLTEPLYDLTSRSFKVTAVVPMFTEDVFIGCVTVDVSLNDIKEFIEGTSIGENGKATLLSAEGKYLAGSSEKNVSKGLKIVDEENKSLAKAGEKVIANESGQTSYNLDGKKYNVYYNTLESNGWKIMIAIPESEIMKPVNQMSVFLVIVCVIAVAVTALVVIAEIGAIIKRIKRVNIFAGILAGGDFTIEPMKIKSQDELGLMAESLNTMYMSNKGVIENIAEHSEKIDASSRELSDAAQRLTEQFRIIQGNMNEVNGSMLTAGAATEQVNASAEEVLSNINVLAGETESSMQMVSEIRERALLVGDNSRKAYDSATDLSGAFEKKLKVTMENAKVVENIGELASVISGIADQIDLLSLNASIEAARAGEQGKGFAVVATEIGKLAKGTAEAVERIQSTIVDVQKAFDDLNDAAGGILDFVKNTVTPDYDSFVGVAEQYGNDAESIAALSQNLSDMSNNIKTIMTEVTDAIQSIAEASQNTSDISSGIMKVVDDVTEDVKGISHMSEDTSSIAADLNGVVGKFKL